MPVKSLKRVIFLLFCLLVIQGVRAQVTLVEWNFPSSSPEPDLIADGGIVPNLGQSLLSNGTSAITFVTGYNTSCATATGWNSGIGTKSWEIHLTTTGYNNITLSSRQRSSSSGPKDFKIIYSIDNGASWTDAPSASITVADNWTSGYLNNISLPFGCANLTELRIRWIMTSNNAVGGGSVGASGTSRIDDIIVKGTISCPVTVTSFTPTTGPVGTIVTITGTNFTGATAVQFNGIASTNFTVVNDNTIIAQVPASAATGKISVLVGCSGVSTSDFTVISSDCSMGGTNVILSELCDPTTNYQTDRYIEIFNPTPSSINLTGWQVRAISNVNIAGACGNVNVHCWNLSGTIAPGQALTCGYTNPINGGPHDFTSANWSTYATSTTDSACFNWNGQQRDGAVLYDNLGVRIDGILRANNGSAWYSDSAIYRNPNICSPNPNSPYTDWIVTTEILNAGDSPSTPGSHTTNCTGTHPDITTHPIPVAVCAGSNASFSVAASGGLPPYNYQWKVYTGSGTWQIVTNVPPYSGATTTTLTITNVQATFNNYQYYCEVYNADNSCYQASNAAMLNVGSGPAINQVNVTHPTCGFSNGQIEIVISGGTSPYYYSIDDGATWLPAGGTANTNYTFTNLAPGTNYRIRVKDAGCEVSYTGNPVTLTNTGNPPVDPTSLSVDRNNFCEDDAGNITLTLNGGSGEQVQWFTGSCGGTLINTGAGNTYTFASPTVTTTYYARWTTVSCGTSNCQSVTVNVLPLPQNPSSITVDRNNFCADDAGNILLTLIGGSGEQVQWFTGSCGGTLINTTAGNTYTLPSPTVTTTYYARWTTTTCGSTTCQSVTVTVSPLPVDPVSLSVTPNTPLCTTDGGNIVLTVNGGSGQQIEWFEGSCGGTPIAITATNTYTIPSPVSTTTYYARWITPGCGPSACKSVQVIIDPLPTTADAGPPNAQYCALSFPLNANTPGIGTGMWSQVSGATAIFNNPPLSNPSQTVTVPSVGSYVFRWTISNGSCPPSTDDISITIDNNPTGFATSNSPVCEGATLSLTSTLPGSSYEWYDPAMNLIGNAQTCNIPNVTLAHSGTYTVYVNSAACGLVSATTDVTIVATPAAPSSISVSPFNICENYAGSVTLDAIGGGGDIEWYEGTCSGTLIGNADPWIINNPPLVTTNYFARYTNGGCFSSCTMGTLVVSPSPVANAGADKSVCGSMSTTLEANDPAPNTGLWTKVSGSGNVIFGNAAVYNTMVTVDQYDNYILRWTVSNTECVPVFDEVRITFSNTVTAHASSDSPVCEGNTLHLYCDIAGAAYVWTGPNSFTSSVQNPFITNVTPASSGSYNVDVSSIPGGCPATSAQTTVYISATPVEPSSVTVDRPVVCAGDGFINLQCTGGSGDVVQWFAGSCGSAVIGTGVTLNIPAPATTTNYFALWHSDTCGNSACKQTTVQVFDPPSAAFAGTDQSLCNVFTTSLAATPPVSGMGTWTEDPGNPFPVTISNVNSATSQIQVPAFGIYKLIWTVSNGVCTPNSHTVQIEFGDNIKVIAQANTPVCEGGTLNLSSSISGATSYSWSGPGFSSNISSPSITNVTSANAGDYHLFVYGISGGCPDSDDIVHVDVAPIPAAPVVISDGLTGDLQSVCEASTVIYSITSPVAGSTYIWSLDGGGTIFPLSSSDKIQVKWYSGSGLFKITVLEQSVAGCSGNAADINVSVLKQFEPQASVLLNPNPLCEGSTLSLNLATNIPALDALYSWFKNDELIAGTKEFTTAEVADGDEFYSVVMVNSDCSAQPMLTTDKVVLTVLPRPAISIIPSGDLCSGTQITLTASDSYPVYLWQDGSTSSSTIVNAFGSYWLRITDADNCSNADTLAIEPCEVENAVIIPNAFSPNGDFNNDIFRVIFSDPDQILRFNMTIYNKWGNLVFESNRATIGWNGYLKNGEPAPGDMYTYSVTYRYKDSPDVKNRKQGLITLIR